MNTTQHVDSSDTGGGGGGGAGSNIENLLSSSIKCFQHCVKSERLLCFKIPDKCPTCSKLLNTSMTTFLIPPFILPTPLTLTTTTDQYHLPPYSLLLQPTNGDYRNFLLIINQKHDNDNKIINDFGDLHIGITNSKSEIFDFDSNGLNRNSSKWFKVPSIVIKLNNHHHQQQQQEFNIERLSDTNNILLYNYYYLNFNKWDFILDNSWYNQRDARWSPRNYNEMKFNCLDYIIQFLIDYDYKFQHFNLTSITSVESLKFLVSNQLIEPEFIKCFKYLNLLMKIKTHGYFIETIPILSNSSSSSSIKSNDEKIKNNSSECGGVEQLTMSETTTSRLSTATISTRM